MECSNCKENIVIPDSTTICSKNIAVKQGDSYICNGCYEASMLFCDISEPKKPGVRRNKAGRDPRPANQNIKEIYYNGLPNYSYEEGCKTLS